jgi:hypothetical protein
VVPANEHTVDDLRSGLLSWLDEYHTKMIRDKLKRDVESLSRQLELVDTIDPKVIRLQERICVRREILEEPEAWLRSLDKEKDEIYYDENPE